jgi:hypothetical protein
MRSPEKELASLPSPLAMVVVLSIAVLGTLGMGIFPSYFLDSARQSIVALM